MFSMVFSSFSIALYWSISLRIAILKIVAKNGVFWKILFVVVR